MMSQSGEFNKSYSEFQINRLNFENLCVQESRQNTHCERGTPVIKKTLMVIEEVYQCSPIKTVLYSTAHLTNTVMTSQSIPSHCHTIEDIYLKNIPYGTVVNTPNFNKRNAQGESEIQSIKSYYDDHDRDIPMDIDLSFDNQTATLKYLDSTENMDIDLDQHHSEIKRENKWNSLDNVLQNRKLKKGSIILPEKEITKVIEPVDVVIQKKNRFSCVTIILIMLISVLLSTYLLQDRIIITNRDIQLEKLQNDLSNNVYGQEGIIKVIIRSIQNQSHWTSKIKVLSFIGSSGVGKTFVANILKQHFRHDLIHELYGNHIDFKKQWENVSSRLKHCCLNLIIIDNLNKKDTSELFTLVHSLPKNYDILILSIFSIQYSDEKLNHFVNFDDIEEIRHKFDDSDLFHELAVFHQFDDVQVKDWLEKQIKVQNIHYSNTLLHNVLYNHDAAYEGLKGLYSKFLLEFERLRRNV